LSEIGWGIHAVATFVLLLFGAHAFALLLWRRRRGPAYLARLRTAKREALLGRTVEPTVLVQIPIYNEDAVAERVLDAVAAMDWPRDRLEIQVLDDSTDSTREIVDAAVRRHRESGVPMTLLRRSTRAGFKAGALAAGLRESDAEFVAIFDADFVPPASFVREGLGAFEFGDRVACVQGRWEHLNREQNLLTRAQAIAVDAHFHVQQLARAAGPGILNFNGTAGIWRRAAIDDAGGWSGDTLTEDLDLSYRAQLRGWRLVFDPDLVAPAELPPTLAAYKSQQRRWACGSVQCLKRFLVPVLRSSLPLAAKVESLFHLGGYLVCVAMVVLILLVPLGFARVPAALSRTDLLPLFGAIWLAALGPLCVAAAGQRAAGRRRGVRSSLAAMLLGLGACTNNALAALRGFAWPIPTFVRTPKQGGTHAPPDAHRAPTTELVVAAVTLCGAAMLAVSAPAAIVSYAVFCFSGVWTLCVYWGLVERRSGAT